MYYKYYRLRVPEGKVKEKGHRAFMQCFSLTLCRSLRCLQFCKANPFSFYGNYIIKVYMINYTLAVELNALSDVLPFLEVKVKLKALNS